MNLFSEKYRELFRKTNFCKSGTFLFVEAPQRLEDVKIKGEAPKEMEVAEPMTAENFNTHQQRFDKQIDALVKLNPEKGDQIRAEFGKKLANIQRKYKVALQMLGKEKTQEAAGIVSGDVNTLIDQIKGRIKAAGGEVQPERPAEGVETAETKELTTKVTAKLKAAEIDMSTLTIHSTLEDAVRKIPKDLTMEIDTKKGLTLDDRWPTIVKLTDPPAFLLTGIGQKDTIKKLKKLGVEKVPEEDLKAALNLVKKGKLEAAPKLTDARQATALDLIAKQFEQAKNPFVRAMIEHDIDKLDFSADQLKQLDENILELTNKQEAKIRVLLPMVKKYDDKEAEHIDDFLTDEWSNAEDIQKDRLSQLESMFDDTDDPMRQYLGQMFKIEKREGGGLVFTNGKGEKIEVTKAEDFIKKGKPQLLPESSRKILEKMMTATDQAEIDKQFEEFQKMGKEQLEGLKIAGELQSQLFNPENMEKPGFMGSIMMLFALWKSIMEAINSDPPDLTTLNEFLEDWNAAKSPKGMAKLVEKSKDSYTECMEKLKKGKEPKLSDLLQAYINPRGPEADKLFNISKVKGRNVEVDPKHPMARHRKQAKPAILAYVQSCMPGVKIKAIDKTASGDPKMIAYTGMPEQKIEITIGATTEAGETDVSVIIPAKKKGEEPKALYGQPKVTVKSLKELQRYITEKKTPAKRTKVAERPKTTEKGPKITDEMRAKAVSKLSNKQRQELAKLLVKQPDLQKEYRAAFIKKMPEKKDRSRKNMRKFQKDFLTSKAGDANYTALIDKYIPKAKKPEKPTV